MFDNPSRAAKAEIVPKMANAPQERSAWELRLVNLQSATNGSHSSTFPGESPDPFVKDGVALTFLIVEDEAAIALDLQSIIMSAGGQVLDIAATAADAERLASALRPDVILMDVRLRGE